MFHWWNRASRIEAKVDVILSRLSQMAAQEKANFMATVTTLEQLAQQVAQNTSVEESAVTLITGIAAQLAAAKTDPAKIQALADQLSKSAADLSASITANTPAAPAA